MLMWCCSFGSALPSSFLFLSFYMICFFNLDFSFALHAAIELQGMSAFVGGVLAQEIVKATGEYWCIAQGFVWYSSDCKISLAFGNFN